MYNGVPVSTPIFGRGSWTQLVYTNAGPSPRYDHATILDPVRNQLVVFGGRGNGTLGDTWALDMTTQTGREITSTISTTKPAPRFGHGAVYDASNRRMLVVMGEGSAFFNDVWSFNLDSEVWTELKVSAVTSTSPQLLPRPNTSGRKCDPRIRQITGWNRLRLWVVLPACVYR